MKENESSRTSVQIHKSCVKPNDEDLRVNWLKEDIKLMNYRQSMITHEFPIEKLYTNFQPHIETYF